jgi:hypothetical protein
VRTGTSSTSERDAGAEFRWQERSVGYCSVISRCYKYSQSSIPCTWTRLLDGPLWLGTGRHLLRMNSSKIGVKSGLELRAGLQNATGKFPVRFIYRCTTSQQSPIRADEAILMH